MAKRVDGGSIGCILRAWIRLARAEMFGSSTHIYYKGKSIALRSAFTNTARFLFGIKDSKGYTSLRLQRLKKDNTYHLIPNSRKETSHYTLLKRVRDVGSRLSLLRQEQRTRKILTGLEKMSVTLPHMHGYKELMAEQTIVKTAMNRHLDSRALTSHIVLSGLLNPRKALSET